MPTYENNPTPTNENTSTPDSDNNTSDNTRNVVLAIIFLAWYVLTYLLNSHPRLGHKLLKEYHEIIRKSISDKEQAEIVVDLTEGWENVKIDHEKLQKELISWLRKNLVVLDKETRKSIFTHIKNLISHEPLDPVKKLEYTEIYLVAEEKIKQCKGFFDKLSSPFSEIIKRFGGY